MSTDNLSSCLSLPTILSYLNYDQVVRCMQVNNKIENSIKRNWNIMQRKEIYLTIENCSPFVTDDEIVTVLLGDKVPRNEIQIIGSKWSYLRCQNNPLIEELMERNCLPQSWKRTSLTTRCEMNPGTDGLKLLLEAMLPRVNIKHMELKISRCPDTTMKTVLEILREHYSSKDKTAVLTVKQSNYLPVYHEIGEAIGAYRMNLRYKGEDRLYLSRLDTDTMEIIVHECRVPLYQVNVLLQEWQAGKRNIKLFVLREGNVNWKRRWDQLCIDMGGNPRKRPTLSKKSNYDRENVEESYFELRRLDNMILEVIYYQAKHFEELRFDQLA